MIKAEKKVGLQFYPNKVMNALVKGLPEIKWSAKFNMAYVPNKKENIEIIFKTFKGIAWVDGKYFFDKKPINSTNKKVEISLIEHFYKMVPKEFLDKLILKRYAENTIKGYCNMFAKFMHFYETNEVNSLTEKDIREYLKSLVITKRSDSYIHQSVNAIKFYYEIVLQMPNRFYELERPQKKRAIAQSD